MSCKLLLKIMSQCRGLDQALAHSRTEALFNFWKTCPKCMFNVNVFDLKQLLR